MLDKNTQELLLKLAELNIKLWVDDNQLRINAPKGALTQDLRNALQVSKANLLDYFSGLESVDSTETEWPQLHPDLEQRYDPFPLTEIQHAYWMGRNSGIELGNVATHYYFELDCEGLDLPRFNVAFNKLIRRHDMLRGIVEQDGTQRILQTVPEYQIPCQDFRENTQQQKESGMAATRAEMEAQVLPADQWPLFDIRANRFTNEMTRVYFSWDFINQDAWSLYVLFGEWYTLYHKPQTGLPSIAISYRDYVLAERELRDNKRYLTSRDYWWQRIDTLPSAPALPVNTRPVSGQQHRFRRRRHRLPLADWQSLKSHAQAQGVTATTLLLGAFAEVLALWSENPHFCLNLTLYHRLPLHDHVDRLTGDFTNLSLLEIDNRQGENFKQRLDCVQKQFFMDLEHRYISGVEVMREWSKRKATVLQAVMPVVFTSNLVHRVSNAEDSGSIEEFGRMVYGISQTPQIWLDNQIMEDRDGLVFNWDAVEEIFAPGILDEMFTSYCQLLEKLAQDPEHWLRDEVVTLPDEQRYQRLTVNNTATETSKDTLYGLFVKQCRRDPGAIALEWADSTLSYGQLLEASRQLGLQLMRRGVKRGQQVAVVMDKGWQQVVAVLGVMHAGAAYVPIATDLPVARLAQLLEESGAVLVLTQTALQGQLVLPDSIECLILDETISEQNAMEDSMPAVINEPGDLAYVIFTSGSTGVPKGVMIDHRGAVNTVLSVNQLFNVSAQDKVLAVSALSFDLSVYDIFGTLAAGGTLVIPEARRANDPDHWHELLQQKGVTIWNSAPPLLGVLVDYLEVSGQMGDNAIRLALLSGDWVPVSLPDRARALFKNLKLVSLGGATEASIWSVYYLIAEVNPAWQSIPYGRPLPNQTLHVLNSRLQPCPVGVNGDIYIGGCGLALGYLNDEEKTTQHFIKHPLGGERLYFTGDKGRYGADGNIEFLGRGDSQVKLHGYRVELGEVAANIQSHAGIEQAVVRKIENGDKHYLQAYVVPHKGDHNPLYETVVVDKQDCKTRWQALCKAGDTQVAQFPKQHAESLWQFTRFWNQVEQISLKVMLEALDQLITTPLPVDRLNETLRKAGVSEQHFPLLKQWLTILAKYDMLSMEGQVIDKLKKFSMPVNVARSLEDLSLYANWNENACALYEYVVRCFTNQLPLLKDQVKPLNLLFPQGDWAAAESLYQYNPISAYHNTVMADIVRAAALHKNSSARIFNILEIGAGTGASTASLLPVLDAEQTHYQFTDVSSFFLAQAKHKFRDFPFVQYGTYDLDLGVIEQGYRPHSYDLLVANNVLHDAKNIPATLEKLRRLLVPGGYLLLLEGTQNTPFQMVTVAFLEGFGHFQDARLEANLPLLNIGQWRAAIEMAGYPQFYTFPQNEHESGAYVQHLLLAQAPTTVQYFTTDKMQTYLQQRLPEYMIPRVFTELDNLPLTVNGKVNLNALPSVDLLTDIKQEYVAPGSEYEKKLAEIWCDVLALDVVGIHNNFFDMGGDSLLIMQLRNKVQATFDFQISTTLLFEHTTISELAAYLNNDVKNTIDFEGNRDRAVKQRNAAAKRRKQQMEQRDYA